MTEIIVKGKTQTLWEHGRDRIPGGTQLLSKRPELFAPDQWPAYYSKARGVEVWDLDGTHYIEMSLSAIGACVLGYGDPDVDAAVREAIAAGNSTTLNCPEEVELADLLCALHPWAEKVRYTRCGGEAMAVAVRIARAHTRRDKIAFCGYHGWHDWYLAANLSNGEMLDGHLLPGLDPAGVPRGLSGTALPFHYNAIQELKKIVEANHGEIAAIVMEPVRNTLPEPDFLQQVREMATHEGAVMIFDEVSSGFRHACGGAHLKFGVNPDIAVFAKGLSNGYPMAAIIGTSMVMASAQLSFISSTYWTDRIGPTAALATIRKFRANRVEEHLDFVGRAVQHGWSAAAGRAGLRVHVTGIPPLSYLQFDYPNAQAVATLFTQEMLDRGFLASKGFYPTFAHRQEHVDLYLAAVSEVFGILAQAIAAGTVERQLKGPVAHSGFKRLT